MRRWILDRYLLREWIKILVLTALGFPLIIIAFNLTDKLGDYLSQGIKPSAIALGYLYSLPSQIFQVLPATVLFATVFSVSAMNRHSELTAAKASGRSFYRIIAPVMLAAVVTMVFGFLLGEVAPAGSRRQAELLGDIHIRSQSTRYNFVYRADHGWVYVIRSLQISAREMRNVVLERAGTGPAYPTLAVQSARVTYDTAHARWTLHNGRMRVISGLTDEQTIQFDSMYQRTLVEKPAELLAEPKKPEEMRYAELGRYIDDLERSGSEVPKLRVDRELKLSIPFTCIVIALFGAPLALTSPRGSGAVGVGLSLGTTVVFLTMIQLSRAIGAGGALPPVVAAWLPNVVFLGAGAWLMKRART